MKYIFIFTAVILFDVISNEQYCNIPKNCQVQEAFNIQKSKNYRLISCSIKSQSHMDPDNSNNTCKSLQGNVVDLFFKPSINRQRKLTRNALNLTNLKVLSSQNDPIITSIVFNSFKAFDIDLFEPKSFQIEKMNDFILSCFECVFDFHQTNKRIESCDEMNKTVGINGPRSIFQLFSLLYPKYIRIFLSDAKNKLCPLVFKNFYTRNLVIEGYNSFYSRKTLSFTSHTFHNLNSNITALVLLIPNVNIDLDLINPSVFKKLKTISLYSKVGKIDPNLFNRLKTVAEIYLNTQYFRSLMHSEGIEWIKSMNLGLTANLSDLEDLKQKVDKMKYIFLKCDNNLGDYSISETFPDEDFCLYKDFPFTQLVYLLQGCKSPQLSCTFLYLIQYYQNFLSVLNPENIDYRLTWVYAKLEEYKSISKCNFDDRLNRCNRSKFQLKHIRTVYEISEIMQITKIVIHISSYPLSIFGIVTNILVIITISSKKNKADYKGLKQYSYLRINSIVNVLILSIHISTWLNRCEFPYQVFCSQIRKVIFFQYFIIIVHAVVLISLQFMNNFTYMAFSFNRISLIGKDHNKLVNFMSDVGVIKYISSTFIMSVGLSVIKFFAYRINYGQPYYSYPVDYGNLSTEIKAINLAFFIINSICDIFNYCIFLFVHLIIDIGMLVKLRETLNAKLDKTKSMCSKEDQEKKRIEYETVINNAVSMVVVNTTIGFLLKFPACAYSILMLVYNILKIYDEDFSSHQTFARFYLFYCVDASVCEMFLHLSDFLYLISLSIPLFLYNCFDKKFRATFERVLF